MGTHSLQEKQAAGTALNPDQLKKVAGKKDFVAAVTAAEAKVAELKLALAAVEA